MKKLSTSISGVYRIACHRNGKVYVGRAVNVTKRWTRHRWELGRGDHRNGPLQADWKQYGADAFTFETVCVIDGLSGAELDEALAQAEHAALSVEPNAYNLMEAGRLSLTASDETRAKLSVERKLRWADPAYRARLSASHKARHADPEFADRRAEAIRAARGTPEQREATRQQSVEKWAAGGALRETQGANRKAKWAEPGYREKQKAARQAVWADPVVKARRSAAISAGHARRRAAKEKPPEV